MIATLGISHQLAATIFGVFLVSFAGTTLDTAARIQRYVIAELAMDYKAPRIANKYVATFLAVVTAAILAFSNKGGTGALTLWPLFGAVNQLLAGLALLIITVYLKRKDAPVAVAAVPMVFMIGMTGYAMVLNILDYLAKQNILLLLTGLAVMVLEIWMIVEAAGVMMKKPE